MQKNDLKLIAEFLEESYRYFQDFLDDKEIEPSEAELILDDLKKEIGPKGKPGVKQAKAETDDLPCVGEVNDNLKSMDELRAWLVAKFPKEFLKVSCVSTNDVVRVIKKKLKRGKKTKHTVVN